MTYRKKWTKQEETTLAELIADGKTHKQAGRVLGRTEKAIQQRVCYTGKYATATKQERKSVYKDLPGVLNVIGHDNITLSEAENLATLLGGRLTIS